MTLVKARAALEEAVQTELKAVNPKISVIFDNTPFTTPGKTKSYVLLSVDFTQATEQPQGDAINFYSGTITCRIMTASDKGTFESTEIAETLITALTNINASTYVDTYSVSPRISTIEGPTSVANQNTSHYMSVVSCNFTANA